MLCLPGWGGVEREQRFGSFQGQKEGCRNKEGGLSGAQTPQRKRGERPVMKEAGMVSFPPALGLWAQMMGSPEKRPPGHHTVQRGRTSDSKVTDSGEADKDIKLCCRVGAVQLRLEEKTQQQGKDRALTSQMIHTSRNPGQMTEPALNSAQPQNKEA